MNDRLLTVWDPKYHSTAAPLTSTTKQRAVVARANREGLLRFVPVVPFEPEVVWGHIAQTHEPGYVEAVRTGEPRPLAESQWFEWSPAFAESVARIWRGHERASFLALHERTIVAHPVSGAHHARYAEGAAFCTFNYLAVERTPRTFIIDTDAHYGDGTDAMTLGSSHFYHFDIHGGFEAKEEKTARGQWYSVRDAGQYFKALDNLPAALDREPDLVHWQAGMDPYEHDTVGGIEGMDARALYNRDLFIAREIVRRRIPCVVTLAGGYIEGVERLHVQTFRAIRQAFREAA